MVYAAERSEGLEVEVPEAIEPWDVWWSHLCDNTLIGLNVLIGVAVERSWNVARLVAVVGESFGPWSVASIRFGVTADDTETDALDAVVWQRNQRRRGV